MKRHLLCLILSAMLLFTSVSAATGDNISVLAAEKLLQMIPTEVQQAQTGTAFFNSQ